MNGVEGTGNELSIGDNGNTDDPRCDSEECECPDEERHLLDGDAVDGLRCLANVNMDATPLCMLLLGQPTLRRRLRLGPFTALNQRVTLRYTMAGLDETECASYIAHHRPPTAR